MSTKTIVGLVVAGILGLVLLIGSLIMIKFASVKGSELGVRETWTNGIDTTPLTPGTHFLFPGFTQTVYTYDTSSQIFIMKDKDPNAFVPDPKKPNLIANPNLAHMGSFHVQSEEGQDMTISLNVRWRLDPDKIIEIHRSARENIVGKLVHPAVIRIVKDEATVRKAIVAYSGEGLVQLQKDIQKDLMNPNGELAKKGIIVETFVIESIKLDDTYISEIRARQVATQKKLRSDEETKAAEAEALKAKATAQSELNKAVVKAEQDRQVGVLKAEQEAAMEVLGAKAAAQKVELAAKADQTKVILAADGEKQAGLFKAQAIEALGKAKAEATRLELSAYAVPGSDNYTKIKVAESMGVAFSGIKGFLPSDMKIHVLSENFSATIDNFLNPKKK